MLMYRITFIATILAAVQGQETAFFWQLTDLHYDPWYTRTGGESCNYNLTAKGKYGDFECDIPWELVRSSVKAMVDLHQGRDADFILWSGDNTLHANNGEIFNEQVLMDITRNITDIITESFPNTLVIPVLGNHDFYPKNQLPGDGSPIYENLADMWENWINNTDAQATFRQGGYFTLMLNTEAKVRGVILNTNLYLTGNSITEGEEDPGNQFLWMEQVMESARQNGEKVHLFMHVPPGKVPTYSSSSEGGVNYLRAEMNGKLIDTIKTYCDIILGIYSAHSHQDSYKLFYDNDGIPSCAMFIAPSSSPKLFRTGEGDPTSPAHNPGLRRYNFESSTYQLLDVEQYSLNLNKANEDEDDEWMFLYSFKGAYMLDDVSPGQLQVLLDDMKVYASDSFHRYYDLNSVNTDHEANGPCSCDCKTKHLCAIEYTYYDEFDQCYLEQAACSAVTNTINLAVVLFLCVVQKLM